MTMYEDYAVFPEGGCQEIPESLGLDDLVDLNGRQLALPLSTARMIAYRVVKIRRTEERGIHATYHYLELVSAAELITFCR
jgi:hypothetical protein